MLAAPSHGKLSRPGEEVPFPRSSQVREPEMNLPFWASVVKLFRKTFGMKSNVQEDLNLQNKEGASNPRELELTTEKKEGASVGGEKPAMDTPTETCNGPPHLHGKTSQCSNLSSKKPTSWKRRRRVFQSMSPDRQQGEATKFTKAVPASPRQLEEAADQQAGLADEVKFEKQVALGLLTFSAGAVITAKGTTITGRQGGQHPAASGLEVNPLGFFFCGSIALWFTSLLFSLCSILLATLLPRSRGLVIYARVINCFSVCVAVLGVAFWIIA